MTRHLYRAKRKDNGRWVEGYYVLLHKTTVCCGEEPEDNAVHQIVYEHMTDWNLTRRAARGEFAAALYNASIPCRRAAVQA